MFRAYRIFLFWLAVCVAAAIGISAASAVERRAAIVIGNSDYDFAPIPNPRNDATLIATVLSEMGFDVLLFHNVGKASRNDLEETIERHLSGAKIAIFYFAGHGLQFQGRNLLLPIDSRTRSASEVVEDAIAVDRLIDIVKGDPAGVTLFILDACRNSPITAKGLQHGLGDMDAGGGQVLVAFATRAGQVAYDGSGPNSPYSVALANALQQPGLDLYEIFRTVRGDVRRATGGAQIPWVTGSIENRFVLNTGDAGLRADRNVSDMLSLDEVFWHFIKESIDPADFVLFRETFSKSRLSAQAAERNRNLAIARHDRSVHVDGPLDAEPLTMVESTAPGPEIVFEQSGERAVMETLRRWPTVLPANKEGLATLVSDCDLDAADPADPQRVVPGVSIEHISIRRAVRSCAVSLAKDKDNPRMVFQFGRALEAAKRYDWAAEFYGRAAHAGYSAAMVNLGHLHRLGKGHPVDYRRAFEWFMQAAALGNLRARVNVGAAYMRGQGVPASAEEGALWYQLAASSGWPQALAALGDAYRRGTGVRQNHQTAVTLYTAAAEGGHLDALTSLGRAYVEGWGMDKNPVQGLELLLRASELGNQYAPCFAARIFRDGRNGIARDLPRALSLFELAAARGFEEAYLDLALGFRDGIFPPDGRPDLETAYYHAARATLFGVAKSKETKTAIGKRLTASTRSRIEAEAALFVQQNGL